MQNERTLKFWDDYHADNGEKEWIVNPSEDILTVIHSTLFDKETRWESSEVRMLEIGCGTSSLARDLWQYVDEVESGCTVHMCATDVSEICIQKSLDRDRAVAGLVGGEHSSASGSSLEYMVLNVLESAGSESTWDVVMDKGCLDTFLFRSRQRGENHVYTNLLQTALDNLWTWMANDAVYILISPRPKLRAVRDYAGFSSVERIPILSSARASLVGKTEAKAAKKDNPGYVYICRKNKDYVIGETRPFVANYRELPSDDSQCPHCGFSFLEFRKGESVEHRGVVFWTREWKNHCIHCKAPHNSMWGK